MDGPVDLRRKKDEVGVTQAMSDAYKMVKAGRLVFKGGEAAGADKKKRKKKKRAETEADAEEGFSADAAANGEEAAEASEAGGEVYTIDPAKKMKYEELFPVETRKFGYDPKNKSRKGARTAEEALDDRVKKKADRYCK